MTIGTSPRSIPKPLKFILLILFLWLVISGVLTATTVVAERTAQIDAQRSEFITECAGRDGDHRTDQETGLLLCEKGARRPKEFEYHLNYPGDSFIGFLAAEFIKSLSFGIVGVPAHD